MSVSFVAPRVPLVDLRTGLVSREWYLFFQTLMQPGNADDELTLLELAPSDKASDAVVTALGRLRDDLASQPPVVAIPVTDDLTPPAPLFVAIEEILPIIGGLCDELAMLRRRFDDLMQGPMA